MSREGRQLVIAGAKSLDNCGLGGLMPLYAAINQRIIASHVRLARIR